MTAQEFLGLVKTDCLKYIKIRKWMTRQGHLNYRTGPKTLKTEYLQEYLDQYEREIKATYDANKKILELTDRISKALCH